jgi:hypothetical protein
LTDVPDFRGAPANPVLVHAGILPSDEDLTAAIREIVRRYPYGGNQLEAALRDAAQWGWNARHHWEPGQRR